jgi:predicted transcriptional regulator
MTKQNKNADFVFMSTGLFEYLSETEAYIFSFIAYFASDQKKGRLFKRTTISICSNTGYSPNTVRAAIESLINKSFLQRIDPPAKTNKNLRYNYIEDVSHHLVIGGHDYAVKFSTWLSIMLDKLRDGSSKTYYQTNKADISFFKVYVSALRPSSLGEKWKRNQSKHLHKTLVLHGYIYNQMQWNEKKGRGLLSRSVGFLSTMMQWSRNTIRRVINTLYEMGVVKYAFTNNRVVFKKVKMISKVRKGYSTLLSKLFVIDESTNTVSSIERLTDIDNKPRISTRPSPKEAVNYLNNWKNKTS